MKSIFSLILSLGLICTSQAAELYSFNNGNFFLPGEILSFKLDLSEAEFVKERVVRFDLCDFENQILMSRSIELEVESTLGVEFSGLNNEGFYKLRVSLDNAELVECTLGVLAAADPKKEVNYTDRFGVVAHLKHMSNQTRDTMLDLIQRAGFGWIREGFLWHEIETRPGVWETSRYDDLVDRAFDHGICVLPVLCFGNSWTAEDESVPADLTYLSQPREADWKNYVTTMVQRYGDRIHAWEIWNEPNLKTFLRPNPDADVYAEIINQAAETIRKLAPDDTIVAAGLSPCEGYLPNSPEQFEVTFISRLAEEDTLPFDALGQHPYTVFRHGVDNFETETLFLDNLRNISKGLEGHDIAVEDFPVWLTEMGVSTIPRITTERDAAGYMALVLTVAAAQKNTPRIIIYNFRDMGNDPTNKEHMFGLLHADNTPKPSYFSVRTFIQKIGNATTFLGRVERDGLVIYAFHSKEGQRIEVVWASGDSVPMLIPEGSSSIINLVNQPARIYLKDQNYYTNVSSNPIYIEY